MKLIYCKKYEYSITLFNSGPGPKAGNQTTVNTALKAIYGVIV